MNTEKNIPHLQSESHSGGTACTFPTLSVRIIICGIYKITSPSKKIYIGQSINIYSRWNEYKKFHFKGKSRLHNSLKKYGLDKHKFEVIHQCIESELNNLEKYYVDLFQTFNSEHGMNLRDGGGSKGKWSEEIKKKISEARKGTILSKETKRKIGLAHKGKIVSKETRKKMSEAKRGTICSEETKRKISEVKRARRNKTKKK